MSEKETKKKSLAGMLGTTFGVMVIFWLMACICCGGFKILMWLWTL